MKTLFAAALFAAAALAVFTALKIDRIQIASDGGYILSASKGYAFDPDCQFPHWYVAGAFSLIELGRVATLAQRCDSTPCAMTTGAGRCIMDDT
jgi:hypothetical protein